jgi:hypothetical protein
VVVLKLTEAVMTQQRGVSELISSTLKEISNIAQELCKSSSYELAARVAVEHYQKPFSSLLSCWQRLAFDCSTLNVNKTFGLKSTNDIKPQDVVALTDSRQNTFSFGHPMCPPLPINLGT